MKTHARVNDLRGHLGRDAEVRTTLSGKQSVSLSVAVAKDWDKDSKKFTGVEYWPVVVFGERNTKFASMLKKGDAVSVIGELSLRKWTAQDGSQRERVEIVVGEYRGEVDLLFAKSRGNGDSATGAGRQKDETKPFDDEIPF